MLHQFSWKLFIDGAEICDAEVETSQERSATMLGQLARAGSDQLWVVRLSKSIQLGYGITPPNAEPPAPRRHELRKGGHRFLVTPETLIGPGLLYAMRFECELADPVLHRGQPPDDKYPVILVHLYPSPLDPNATVATIDLISMESGALVFTKLKTREKMSENDALEFARQAAIDRAIGEIYVTNSAS